MDQMDNVRMKRRRDRSSGHAVSNNLRSAPSRKHFHSHPATLQCPCSRLETRDHPASARDLLCESQQPTAGTRRRNLPATCTGRRPLPPSRRKKLGSHVSLSSRSSPQHYRECHTALPPGSLQEGRGSRRWCRTGRSRPEPVWLIRDLKPGARDRRLSTKWWFVPGPWLAARFCEPGRRRCSTIRSSRFSQSAPGLDSHSNESSRFGLCPRRLHPVQTSARFHGLLL